MRNQDHRADVSNFPGGREEGGDDATEAGGGNLHRGRGATAWGREEGGDNATEASDHESLSVPKTSKKYLRHPQTFGLNTKQS